MKLTLLTNSERQDNYTWIKKVKLAQIPVDKLDDSIAKCRVSALKRDRVGPFLGQILSNTSCKWDTPELLSFTSGSASIIRKPAIEIFKDRLAEIEKERIQEEAVAKGFAEDLCSHEDVGHDARNV